MNWCRMAELNCPLILTMDVCYHYTNAACIYYIKMKQENNIFIKDALCDHRASFYIFFILWCFFGSFCFRSSVSAASDALLN